MTCTKKYWKGFKSNNLNVIQMYYCATFKYLEDEI